MKGLLFIESGEFVRMHEQEYRMFFDFYHSISESICALGVSPTKKLIFDTMKRVDKEIESLYQDGAVNSEQFQNRLSKLVEQVLFRKGITPTCK